MKTMSFSLHPAVATLAALFLVISYLYGGYLITSINDEGTFDVQTVVASLLAAEAAVGTRHGATVAVAFGACRDRLASSSDVMRQLGVGCQDSVSNVAELSDVADLQKTFSYYFKNGASAGRAIKNASFFVEVEDAFTSLPSSRVAVGGNAPVMVQRFVSEGVHQVLLGASMSPELRSQLDSRVQVVGDEISASEEDTHLILEYELNDICGNMTAPRANRFIMHKKAVGQHHLTSLIEQFTRELLRSPPDLLVIGGLRQLLAAEASPAAGPTPLTRLSQMLKAAHPSMRIHVELSTFADQMTLRDIIEQVVQYSDSLGLNEQELPALRRQLVNWHSTVDSGPETVLEDSAPSLASVLDDARSTFKLLRHLTAHNHRQFSRLHMHTLAFQVIVTEADSKLWPNTREAIAKAALTSYRHTCGSRTVDVNRAKLLLEENELITNKVGTSASELRAHFTGRYPVVCWQEGPSDPDTDVGLHVCVAPVIVCKHVIQTVGGGDNISAAGLVLQL